MSADDLEIHDLLRQLFSIDQSTTDSHVLVLVSVGNIRKLAHAAADLGYNKYIESFLHITQVEKEDSHMEGHAVGLKEGLDIGFEKGYKEGFNDGYDSGYREACCEIKTSTAND